MTLFTNDSSSYKVVFFFPTPCTQCCTYEHRDLFLLLKGHSTTLTHTLKHEDIQTQIYSCLKMPLTDLSFKVCFVRLSLLVIMSLAGLEAKDPLGEFFTQFSLFSIR